MRIEAPLLHTIPFNNWISKVYISDDGKVVTTSFKEGYAIVKVNEGEVLMRKIKGAKISMIPSKNILMVGVENSLNFYNLIGTLLWKESFSSAIRDFASAENGNVIVATKNEIVCYTNFHNVVWRREWGGDKVVMDPSGRYFVIAEERGIKFCETSNANIIWEREFLEDIVDIKIQRGGHRVLAVLSTGDIFLFSKSGDTYWEYKLKYVPKVAFDYSGNIVVGEGNNVKIFNDRGTVLKSWELDGTVNFVETAQKSQYLLAGTNSGTIYFFNRDGIVWDYKHVHPIMTGCVSPYGEHVVAANKHILFFSNINYYESVMVECDRIIKRMRALGYDVKRLMEIYQKMRNAYIKKDFDILMSYKRAFDNLISRIGKAAVEYAIFTDNTFTQGKISRIIFYLKGKGKVVITEVKVYGNVRYKAKISDIPKKNMTKGTIYIMPKASGRIPVELIIKYRSGEGNGEIRQKIALLADGKRRKVKVYSNTDYKKLTREVGS